MAEGALLHLAEKVLELLRSLTLQEVKLASSVKTETKKLIKTVSTIQAVILDAEKQSSQDHQIKDWLRKLRMFSMMQMTCWMISPPMFCDRK